MTKVLVVYQAIPEETMQFIVDAEEAGLADLKLCHNNYLGLVGEEDITKALSRLNMRLSGTGVTESDMEWAGLEKDQAGVWEDGKVLDSDPIDAAKEGIELVILTGYMM